MRAAGVLFLGGGEACVAVMYLELSRVRYIQLGKPDNYPLLTGRLPLALHTATSYRRCDSAAHLQSAERVSRGSVA
jgi:hypothetical protein